jgi:uncharacterized protein (DUF433 family)
MTSQAAITRSSEILGGTPVFQGTRGPVRTLIDYLESGDSLEVFFGDYPSVSKELAIAVIELASEAILKEVDEAAA